MASFRAMGFRDEGPCAKLPNFAGAVASNWLEGADGV